MNPFANFEFLEFCKPNYINIIKYGIHKSYEGEYFPYFIKNINGDNFFITPICFCGPQSFNTSKNLSLLNFTFKEFSLKGGFIQTRDSFKKCNNIERHNNFSYLEDYRINFRLSINNGIDGLKKNMNSTSRRYTNRILRESDLNEFLINEIDLNDTDKLNIFINYYNHNADISNFSNLYRFSIKQWKKLISCKNFKLYIVFHKGIFISGTIIVSLGNGLGYTFVAHKKSFQESSRINILKLCEYFNNLNVKYIDLGGGLKENDNLSFFKMSLGAEKIFFKRIKFIFKKNNKNNLNLNFLNSNWPPL